MKNSISVFVAFSFVTSQSFARGTAATSAPTANPNASGYTQQADGTLVVTTTTMPQLQAPGDTIKSLGRKSQGTNWLGILMGVAAAGVTARGAMRSCKKPTYMCPVYISGFAASLMVIKKMTQARNQSEGTVAAVSTFEDGKNLNGLADPDKEAVPPQIANDEDYKIAMATKKKLEAQGWKFDTKNGTAKDPSGKTISPNLASSESAMKAVGATPSEITAFQNEMKNFPKEAEKKAKAIDGGSMFADEGGGGGGGTSSQAASTAGGMDGGGYGMPNEKLGIDRNPAQVAGLKKDYHGSPIGVAGDSLFDMVDRRYELHQKNGSFLSP